MSCEICGNKIDVTAKTCPFCGSEQQSTSPSAKKAFANRIVNIERGLPFVETALKRLTVAITQAQNDQIPLITLIHGYGSSGKGGVIREECRKTLDYMKSRGEIHTVIYGEDFSSHLGAVRDAFRRFPQLSDDRNLNKRNKGITVVIL